MAESDPPGTAVVLRHDGAHVLLRWLVDLALALHFAAGAFWWWLSPKGFPFGSSQFWTNSVLPFAAMGIAATGLLAVHRQRWSVAAATVLCFAAAWAAAAVAARIVFPVSLERVWLLMLAVSLAGAMLWGWLLRGRGFRRRDSLVPAVLGAAIGVLVIRLQIPESASTIPWNAEFVADGQTSATVSPGIIQLGPDAAFHPGAALIAYKSGKLRVDCEPLLDFHLISPDRFWSLFAPSNSGTTRRFAGETIADDGRTLRFSDDASIDVRENESGDLTVTAYSPLKHDTYSHLNSFCHLVVSGHTSLSLSFSPCPDAVVDVLPADYPFGRPARFAYLAADGTFHVCEATSGEKGPFRMLASGPLRRGEPLTIWLNDDKKRVCSITFDDWSAQLSTALSPSAGWRIPVNAIEFQRLGEQSSDRVDIWVTLAATSVGRGFETVGHRAGTYRSRMTLRHESSDQ